MLEEHRQMIETYLELNFFETQFLENRISKQKHSA